ncbi:MAG TPA: hypothetical protein VG538_17015 [Vicinamibacterales bacterium]|jgi:hypothetical protein|nr:hypothetical protein [Vicinamibacterales bacterium]
MRMMALVFGTLAALSLGPAAQGGSDAMTVGGVSLRLGMPKESVLKVLSPKFNVDEAAGFVRTKSGPPFAIVGVVGFDGQQRLDYMSRNWEPSDQQAGVPLAEALLGALTQITSPTSSGVRGCADCTIAIKDTPSPGGSNVRTIFFYRSGSPRTIRLDILRLQSPDPTLPGETATITEEVSSR